MTDSPEKYYQHLSLTDYFCAKKFIDANLKHTKDVSEDPAITGDDKVGYDFMVTYLEQISGVLQNLLDQVESDLEFMSIIERTNWKEEK